jgi:membrane-associated phospholipid phosphatase
VAIAWLVLGLSTGLTRPLLQLHHPSDVVAGWLLALGMLALVWLMRPVARCPTA